MNEWTRISAPIENEADRRALVSAGLTVRIVKERKTPAAHTSDTSNFKQHKSEI